MGKRDTTISEPPKPPFWVEMMTLDDCIEMRHTTNPKEHDTEELKRSMRRFKFVAPPTIDEATKVMAAGHGRCLALVEMLEGDEPPPANIVNRDGVWWVPVLRGISFDNERERDAYLIADNQHTIRGGWNFDLLSTMLKDIKAGDGGFDGMGFDDVELKSFGVSGEELGAIVGGMTGEITTPPKAPEQIIREVDTPALPKEPTTKLGDVWRLGKHVLVCGDSCVDGVSRAVAAIGASVGMVWTDPPWNVAYDAVVRPSNRGAKAANDQLREDGAARGRVNTSIMNDDLGDKFPEFCRAFTAAFSAFSPPGIAIYLAMSMQEYALIDAVLREAKWHWSSTIIWAKDALVLGRKDYHSQYEPLWYGWREGSARQHPLRDRGQSDLWEIDRPRRSEDHPTMKPIRLVARSIENSSSPGEVVLDPFGGSGTTMLAAEQTGRRAALVELDPRYCDVIVERFQAMTGISATRG